MDTVTSRDSHIGIEACPKRIRAVFNGETIADSLKVLLLLEPGCSPVYYFPKEDVGMARLRATSHRTHCPLKGDASYWTIEAGGRKAENAVWGYEEPIPGMEKIRGRVAFHGDKVDHWFEEDEEAFGPPRDPHHFIEIRASSRAVRVSLGGEEVAFTRRALFLFETGLPTRYYIPRWDIRLELLESSTRTSICAYKGKASYWSLRTHGQFAEDAVWAYTDPNPEYARLADCLCFDPDKVEKIEVAGS